MKKILVINTKYKNFGGEDSNIIDEIKFLENNYEVKYLEYDNSKKLSFLDLVGFITGSNFVSNKQLIETIKAFQPDLAYVHNTWFRSGLKIFKILKKNKIITYVKIHNFRYDCTRYFSGSKHLDGKKFCKKCGFKPALFNKYFKESFLKSFFVILYGKRYINILKNYTDKILSISNFQEQQLKKIGFNENKTLIFHNPIFFNKYQNTYDPKSNYVVYAGSVSNQKGVKELLDSWAKSDIKNIELRIIGEGSLYQLKDVYVKNINFLGALSHEETLSQIMNSKAVLTATKMYEGQPRLLNEASIFGVPSIFPDFGGMPEFFPQDYELKFEQYNYVDFSKKLNILENHKKLEQISSEVKNHIHNKLNLNSLIKQFESIVNNSIG